MLQVKKIYISSDKFDGTNKCLQTKTVMGLVKMLGWFDEKVAKFEAEDIEKLQFMGMYQNNESIWFDSLYVED